MKGGINILHNLNNRERQIMDIEASFEACKSQPIHSTNKNVQPVEVYHCWHFVKDLLWW
ncbi:hypothetical protein ISN45_Aa06g017510 [Arabidopsis thaliana x Arabidopsis arenosa]|uniref:Uncharacterized protein n=1 Tax=Arabidopsis thaliana x Arabidopsis arenosa TaxID=1240361 RepID=A0A8T1YY30_9BRAS|nr:hypothetical protein ISN45_Aa06g017510 [Arabidopsis thaliana x Arabidopsis arenosa]KAG7551027.1 hypothetical protein ISN45_Aa06g017510 [Arabidopsis thaliana x Arabidopsis arenosa]KAG7551029.1 hypothetical protein ISN45_Aa06g017510 [Arabidopsis thaliana x Arabidopsis arenosa]KAG7551030.1 hypothetical protein ISN45_Aa06g017510 [Arabidopsis thaliana x Arabidopsis arenosa]KAG7551031.1 hypothetical protein ISN45_Aa06g017510 [Arabidopsis thaliana x Arabidopsis arenosa]